MFDMKSPERRYTTPSGLRVTRLEPVIGAEIDGIDLRQSIAPGAAADIRHALVDHGVIFFRNQPIEYAQHLALGRVFGTVWTENYDPDRPEVMVLKSDAANTNPAGGNWHSDGSYFAITPAISILHAVQAAPLGGDTCFSSATAAYRGLPEATKRRIAPLRARASMAHIRKVKGLAGDGGNAAVKLANATPPAEHPVVRVHPVSGEPALYVNECHTIDIVGLPDDESDRLLSELVAEFRRPEYQMRWTWDDHAIAVWDNCAVQHYAVRNEAGARHVERIMIEGVPSLSLVSHRADAEPIPVA